MWKMLQQDTPDDYVIATGLTHSVRDFAEIAFAYAGLNYKDYVVIDNQFVRPSEIHLLIGDPSKAQQQLGWEPKLSFEDLVHEMVEEDLKLLS